MVKTISIDEEGYFLLHNGIRVTDEEVGHQMLSKITIDEFGVLKLNYEGEEVIVEAFDKPLVARMVDLKNSKLKVQMPYHFSVDVIHESLCVDQWDRFHGMTEAGVPFVLSRAAQAELFNIADEFSDDSLTLAGQRINIENYYLSQSEVNQEAFWSNKYQENPSPPWNLDKPHPELSSVLSQLKINKCRILVPGCGYAHDAALLAQRGHVVTAIDISSHAISEAKKLYGHISNLELIEGDVFELGDKFASNFDMIFEHTFYCAVTPDKRTEVVQLWKKLLDADGHLLGIFFVVPKRTGPYFGGSEWELRDHLQNRFRFLYWTRLKMSPGWRLGAELLVYAQLKDS